jgi:hypothetical protein
MELKGSSWGWGSDKYTSFSRVWNGVGNGYLRVGMGIKIHPAPPIAFPCHSIFLFPPSILVFVVPAV